MGAPSNTENQVIKAIKARIHRKQQHFRLQITNGHWKTSVLQEVQDMNPALKNLGSVLSFISLTLHGLPGNLNHSHGSHCLLSWYLLKLVFPPGLHLGLKPSRTWQGRKKVGSDAGPYWLWHWLAMWQVSDLTSGTWFFSSVKWQ